MKNMIMPDESNAPHRRNRGTISRAPAKTSSTPRVMPPGMLNQPGTLACTIRADIPNGSVIFQPPATNHINARSTANVSATPDFHDERLIPVYTRGCAILSCMILILALLACAAGLAGESSTAVIDRLVVIEGSEFKSLHFNVKGRPATLNIEFRVAPEAGRVRLIVIPKVDEDRFRSGRRYTEIITTQFEHQGSIKTHLATPGDYTVIVDNRQEDKRRANVQLRGALTYDVDSVVAKTLSTERRMVVIVVSLG